MLTPVSIAWVVPFLLFSGEARAATILDGSSIDDLGSTLPGHPPVYSNRSHPLSRIWHHHYGKIALAWSVLALLPIAFSYSLGTALSALAHALLAEYLVSSFYCLPSTRSQEGIVVTGNLPGTPLTNTMILAIGAAMASIVGTTGAAMILIRPIIGANISRRHNAHVIIFFIILVANVGGALTPLGDPPLLWDFYEEWTSFGRCSIFGCRPLIVSGLVLAVFVVVETAFFRLEKPVARREATTRNIRLRGSRNFVLIALIIAVILGLQSGSPEFRSTSSGLTWNSGKSCA